MRTIWNGSISFGLVNIPVGLALATQRQDVSFRTLHRECGTPIKQKRWCPVHERDVEPDELVKGWEFAKGQYVLVEEADLEAVALTRSQSIAILRFVRLEDVDPVFFDRTYYPALDRINGRPYAALICAGSDGQNAARQIARIATGWRLKPVAEPLIVCTHAQTPEAILAPKTIGDEDRAACAERGATLAAGLAMGIF